MAPELARLCEVCRLPIAAGDYCERHHHVAHRSPSVAIVVADCVCGRVHVRPARRKTPGCSPACIAEFRRRARPKRVYRCACGRVCDRSARRCPACAGRARLGALTPPPRPHAMPEPLGWGLVARPWGDGTIRVELHEDPAACAWAIGLALRADAEAHGVQPTAAQLFAALEVVTGA